MKGMISWKPLNINEVAGFDANEQHKSESDI